VIDTSGSMTGAPLQQAKAGARVFLESLPDNDAARVLLFSSAPRWLSDRPAPLQTARAGLIAGIEGSFADGGTALYDAVLQACAPSPEDPRGAVRAVVVLTDGQDTDSKIKIDALVSRLRQQMSGEASQGHAPPRVFTIAYGDKADAGVLRQIAEAGGGAFFSGTPKDIKAVYAELATFF